MHADSKPLSTDGPAFSRVLKLGKPWCLLLGLFLAALPVLAQTSQPTGNGAITGVIQDPRSAVITGAKITLTEPQTNLDRSTSTNLEGEYNFSGLSDGLYSLKIQAQGFKTAVIQEIKVSSSRTITQNVALTLGAASEIVTVHAYATGPEAEFLPLYSPISVPASSSISTTDFTRNDIQVTNPANVYEMASLAPGVKTDFQGRKGFNFLEMRGGESLGVILNGYYIPWTQASRMIALIPPDAIESIRIVRDSTTLALGPMMSLATSANMMASSPSGSANQGFLFITTRKGYRPQGGLVMDIGNFGSYQSEVYHGNRIGRLSYWISGYGNVFDGPKNWYDANTFGAVLLSSQYDGRRVKFDLTAFYDSARREMERSAGSWTTTYNAKWQYDPLHSLMVASTLVLPWSEHQFTTFSYAHGQVTDNLYEGTFTSSAAVAPIHEEDYANNFHLWHTIASKNNTLKTGFQAVLWDNPDSSGEFNWNAARQETVYGAYVQDEHRFENRWTVDGGVRVDDKHIGKGYDAYNPSVKPLVRLSDEWTSPAIGVSLGAAYRVNAVYKLTGRFGFSHEDSDPFLANYYHQSLGIEERYKSELGFEGKIRPAFQPKVAFFTYDIHNLKIPDPVHGAVGMSMTAVPYYIATNVVRTGVELTVGGKMPCGFSYNGNYSFISSTRHADDIDLPHNMFSFMLQHRMGNFESGTTVKFVDAYWSNFFLPNQSSGAAALPIQIGDYTVWNANLSYRFKVYDVPVRTTGYARNLTNDQYMSTVGFRDVGRVAGGRLEVFFGR